MAPPKLVSPGTTYFVTHRCEHRALRLRPDRVTSEIFLYALALAAQKTGVQIHAVCVMSNHHHTIMTDPLGRLPDFARELHRTTARALNKAHEKTENLWSTDGYHAEVVADTEALIDRIAYAVANPVSAGLVARPDQWPGVLMWTPNEIDVARPSVYFARNSKCPAVVPLRIEKPSRVEVSVSDWTTRLKARIGSRVLSAHRKIKRLGRKFLGRAAVLAQPITKRVESFEPKRRAVAAVAASCAATLQPVIDAIKRFRIAYREARARWRSGERDVVFPAGTWGLRQDHGVNVALDEPWPVRLVA